MICVLSAGGLRAGIFPSYTASRRALVIASFLFSAAMVSVVGKAQTTDSLRAGFADPPESARPRVFWHWMNGNVSIEGVHLDLEWMKRIGLGGAMTMDVDLLTPKVVQPSATFMSSEWQAAFRKAAEESDRLGLEYGVATSPGWSSTGGPWVKPEQAMKKLVWTATEIDGGVHFHGVLPQPPSVAGPFQDVLLDMMVSDFEKRMSPISSQIENLRFYRDSAVIAYRKPASDPENDDIPTITSNAGNVDAAALRKGDLTKVQLLPFDANHPVVWVRFDYPRVEEIRSVTMASPGPRGFGAPALPQVWLEASQDGEAFTRVVEIPLGTSPEQTVSFPVVRARYFRVVFSPKTVSGGLVFSLAPGAALFDFGAPSQSYSISELRLSSLARIHRFQEKAGFSAAADYDAIPTPEAPAEMCISKKDVIDLTSRLSSDGTLDWTPPPGKWVVLRMGYSLTGHRNGPASPEETGLETDQLSSVHVREYMDHYLELLQQAAGPSLFGGRGVRALLADSIEAGVQNWTENMLAEFKARRGYDATPWLPALTGQIVESADASDRFLWDFRRTIADLVASSHYGQIAASAHALHMRVYSEALEDHRPQLGDDMEMRRFADVPMGAMWTFPAEGQPKPTYVADDLGAASVAHIWGKKLVGAESMTAFGFPWAFAPRDLKPIVDLEFALGVNMVVIHDSTHQPLPDRKPGFSLAPFLGQYFNRNETWAEEAGPWVKYLARNSFLLQQGRFVADIAYFYGEEGPLTSIYGDAAPKDIPAGYRFDFVNSDALASQLSVQDGTIVTPGGMRYRILYLGGASRAMTVATLRKLRDLVKDGAVLVGNAPEQTRSLSDDSREFDQLVHFLWPRESSTPAGAAVGKGKVLASATTAQALAVLGVAPDVEFTGVSTLDQPTFVHRALSDGEIYYLSNSGEKAQKIDAIFRVAGKEPELWRADSGTIEPASFEIRGERTLVPLDLAAHDSLFVVFRKPSTALSRTVAKSVEVQLEEITGPWSLQFESEQKSLKPPIIAAPGSWTESSSPEVKYFSGTAAYSRTISVPQDWLSSHQAILLDLGDVRELAEVSVNGEKVGIGWKPPYKFDITGFVHAGVNSLQIRVTNLWVNRLIGDAQPDAKPVTFTTGSTYRSDAPLRSSGLLGPVRIIGTLFPQSRK
jgi:hypothetical protein